MFNTIEDYLDALRTEMKNADAALTQDALADAREHLSTALEVVREKNPELQESDALRLIIEEYGSPAETASAYREVERLTAAGLKQSAKPRSLLGRFLGVYADPRAWGALFYMFIAFVTGVFYFSWAVTGLALSVSFSIFIFGLLVALLFLMSVRGLALLEGRLVEALLGIRMPRRSMFLPEAKWIDRLKGLATDKHTWLMLVYMVFQFVLGTIYFMAITTVLSFSLSFIAIPFVQPLLQSSYPDILFIYYNGTSHYFPAWSYPLCILGGFLLWTVFMHPARRIGQLHGRFAKWALVRE